jgi:hypothetical protein
MMFRESQRQGSVHRGRVRDDDPNTWAVPTPTQPLSNLGTSGVIASGRLGHVLDDQQGGWSASSQATSFVVSGRQVPSELPANVEISPMILQGEERQE